MGGLNSCSLQCRSTSEQIAMELAKPTNGALPRMNTLRLEQSGLALAQIVGHRLTSTGKGICATRLPLPRIVIRPF